jgi:hypothetical protein
MKRITCVLLLAAVGCAEQAAPEKEEAPPAVRRAECRRVAGEVRIDGKLDEAAWEKAVVLKDFAVYWAKRKPKTATAARLLWDDRHLYFAADMEDSDLFAQVKERNGMTWYDDVFEVFLKPSVEKNRLPHQYYELQVNALNTQLELFLPSRGSGGYNRTASTTRFGMESAVHRRGTLNDWKDRDEGWTVEGRIPWTAFDAAGGRPKAGDRWRFALCRYDYSVAHERPELSSTAPLTQSDFHRYEDYGELVFVGDR